LASGSPPGALKRGTLLAAASFLIRISAHQCVFGWFGFVINKNKERKGKLAESEDPSNYRFFPPLSFLCDSQIVSLHTPPASQNTRFDVRSVTSVL